MKIIILAGGGGTRLWPLSRANKAKQFNSLIDDESILKNSVDRFLPTFGKDNIYISCNQKNLSLANKILPNFSKNNFIIEPEKRDTAPAMGYISAYLFLKFPDEPIAFIPSDHYIEDTKNFLKCFKVAEKIILKTGKLLDIGIKASFPTTALGYTKIGKKFMEMRGVEIYNFEGHTEKPPHHIAKKYLESGDYLWHANYYMLTPRLILEAYKKYAPKLYQHLEKIIKFLRDKDTNRIKEEFSKMEKISFDYAIMEKIDKKQALIIKGDFGWNDIGTWDTLYDIKIKQADEFKNVVKGNWIGANTSNCIIRGSKKKLIATLGVDDLAIIDTDDALLVCPKGKSQEVKKIVEEIKRKKMDKYL